MKKIKVLVNIESFLLRKALAGTIIENFSNVEFFFINPNEKELTEAINETDPSIIIVDIQCKKTVLENLSPKPSFFFIGVSIEENVSDKECFNIFDEIITIYDSKNVIIEKLENIFKKILVATNTPTNTNLSEREKEILKYVAMGFTNKEIAEKLFLSVHTVMTHRKNITAKLGIKTISGLTLYAILNGIVSLSDVKLK